MSQSKQTIEKLAVLSAWVTSSIVLLNLLSVFIIFSVATVESLALMIFVSGTVGGAASNYRRLQKAYAEELKKTATVLNRSLQAGANPPEPPSPEIQFSDLNLPDSTADQLDHDAIQGNRTQAPAHGSEPNEAAVEISYDASALLILRLQIFLSPLFGGLFAIVLYGVFAAGLIQGSIFPTFTGSEDSYQTPHDFAEKTLPATNQDAAKAILWAFVAGFAEGIVPNFIDKLIKDVRNSDRSP